MKCLDLNREMMPGGAIYHIADEGDGSILLGLGLWDRVNEPHTLQVKNRTMGQVVRVSEEDEILVRSTELSSIVYQVIPVCDERIFVGCRDGTSYFLNPDLSMQRPLDLCSKGFYSTIIDDDMLVATMRQGSVLFFNLESEESKIVQVVDPNIRVWPIAKDGTRYIVGSYRGDLAIIEDMKVMKSIKADERAPIWTIDHFDNRYFVGTGKGEMIAFEKDLESRTLMYNNESPLTSSAILNPQQIALGNLHGDIHVLSIGSAAAHFPNPKKEKANTIWSMAPDVEKGILRVAYSNGQMRIYTLT
ncbi:MAG: hypothetical protein KJ709_03375 [Nanoarchaeota archaeon]|nr:hypothetical protein [Nanoarchaeota archaeon]